MDARRLELDLTEDSLTGNADDALEVLSALKRLKVRVALDNFGTGYTSLNHLKSFPLDRIKIDRSIVSEIEPGNSAADITRTIISMAHGQNLEVTAEGVETLPQQTFLIDEQCDELQGYLFARPLPAEALEGTLQRNLHLAPRGASPVMSQS